MQILDKLTRWWQQPSSVNDHLVEGVFADQYADPHTQQQIRSAYLRRHQPITTPLTNPLDYDPCDPPEGWRYDPYYECWVQL